MELIVIIIMLCMSLLVLPAPCASLHGDPLQSYHELIAHEQLQQFPTLPRKLKLNQVATEKENGLDKRKEVSSGKSHRKEAQVMHAAAAAAAGRVRVGTRQEWIQGSDIDTSHFFTMDYTRVRRRRPIHNKSLPIAP